MKAIQNGWRNQLLQFMLFSVVILMLLSPIASNTDIPLIGDYFNHISLIGEAKTAISEGQFPLRVAPSLQDGLGYPIFQFYSPTSYFLAGLLDYLLFQPNLFFVYKALLYLFLLIGAFYVERIAYWFVQSRPAALLASIVYLTTPYLIILVDHLAAFNESLAMGLLPVLLWYVLQGYYRASLGAFLRMMLAWYALVTIHVLTFLSASFFIFLFLLLITVGDLKRIRQLVFVGGAYIGGCILAVWYLIPAFLTGRYFIMSPSFDSQIFYRAYETYLSNLFSSAANISGGYFVEGIKNTISGIHPSIGLPLLMAVSVLIYACVKQKKILSRNPILLALSVTLSVAFLLAWAPINFWKYLPQSFNVFQYSWRLLGQVMWTGSLIFAWAVCWLFKNKLSKIEVVGVLALLFASAYPWLPITEVSFDSVAYMQSISQGGDGAKAYLLNVKKFPNFITIPQFKEKAVSSVAATGAIHPISDEVLTLDKIKKLCRQVKDETICHVITGSKTQLIELPLLYYPNLLDIKVNGKAVKIQSVMDNKQLLAAIVPENSGEQIITARFSGLKFANQLSLFAWLVWLIGVALLSFKSILARMCR